MTRLFQAPSLFQDLLCESLRIVLLNFGHRDRGRRRPVRRGAGLGPLFGPVSLLVNLLAGPLSDLGGDLF